MKKAFTLIELLAVIIILAVIALIATPVVLKVVDNAKESARKSSVSGYADTIRLALVEKQFETGNSPGINDDFLNGLSYHGEKVICEEVVNSRNSGLILRECSVGNDTNKYCFANGKIYACDSDEFIEIYDNANKIVLPLYVDNSGANKPELYDKMIPVIYNTNTGKWKYANLYEKWYDYDLKEWANAVVLNPDKTYDIGQDIEMTDIAMMYVWIPRYKYTVFNGNNGIIAAQEINVIFESGTSKTGTIMCTTNALGSGSTSENCDTITNGISTYTHPAFTFGDRQLKGIWVAKFEASTTDSTCYNSPSSANCNKNTHTIKVIPNVDSLRYTSVSNLFTSIQSIKTKYSMNNVDTHMMKNMEWGAITYLTNSKYGRCNNGTCEEVTINNVQKNTTTKPTQTGCAGNTIDEAVSTTCQNEYYTASGVKASTTGNIYGIYDMSGGAMEYAMGNMVNSSGQFCLSSSGFGTTPDDKYYDKYTYESTSYQKYNLGKLGDATKETLTNYENVASGTWHTGRAFFFYSNNCWILRGQHASNGVNTGIFSFTTESGTGFPPYGSRSVIVAN